MRRTLLIPVLTACMAAIACNSSAGDGAGDGDDEGAHDGSVSGVDGVGGGAVDAPPGTPGDYDHDGPVPFTTQTEQVTNGAQSFSVTVYLPSTPGPHPVVSFACGSTATAALYVPYGRRLASHGI